MKKSIAKFLANKTAKIRVKIKYILAFLQSKIS